MLRIIAGEWRGRKLEAPAGDTTRPTADRTRETLFSMLVSRLGSFEGLQVLDLFAGSGALGLEALSRGARIATFVDQDKRALELARQNVTHCGANNAAFFVQADATRLPTAREAASLVLFDPPYDAPILPQAFASLKAGGWLDAGTLLICEQAHYTPAAAIDGAEIIDERSYGKAKIVVYQVQ